MTTETVNAIADFMSAGTVTTVDDVVAQLAQVREKWPEASEDMIDAAIAQVVQRRREEGEAMLADADTLDELAAASQQAPLAVITFTDAERESFGRAISWGLAAAVEQAVTDFIKDHRHRESERQDLVIIAKGIVADGCDEAALAPFVWEWERLSEDDPEKRYAT